MNNKKTVEGMKRYWAAIVTVLSVALWMTDRPVSVHAGEVGLDLLYSTINEEGVDNGFGFGLNYTHNFTENIAIETGISRTSYDTDADKITTLPLSITAQYRFTPLGQIRPWMGAGAAYYINDVNADSVDEEVGLLNEDCTGLGLDCAYSGSADLDSGIGFHLAAGADFAMSEKVALSLGLAYRIVNPDVEVKLSCTGTDCVDPDGNPGDFEISETDEVDLGGFDISLGVKYIF